MLFSLLLIAPFSFLVGAIFPTACAALGGGRTTDIGRIYIAEGAGSVAGGIVLTYFLLTWRPPFVIVGLIGIGAILMAIQLARPKKPLVIAMLIILSFWIATGMLGYWSKIERYTLKRRWALINPGIELLESADSVYQNIAVGKYGNQISIYSNGNLMVTFPDRYRSAMTAHLIMNQHKNPADILIIGGITGDLLEEMLLYDPHRIDCVDPDRKLLRIMIEVQPPELRKIFKDPRVKLIMDDGRRYIRTTEAHYDIIFVNLPDPTNAMLNRFYTREFYVEARKKLEAGGVLVAGAGSAVNYFGKEISLFTGSIYRTLKNVFRFVEATPGDYSYFFASNSPDIISTDASELSRRFASKRVRTKFFTPYHFQMMLLPERVRFVNKALEVATHKAEINTDAHPITYFHRMILWELFSPPAGKERGSTLQKFAGLKAWHLLVVIVALLGIRIVRIKPWQRALSHSEVRFNSLLAIATTGAAAMASEIVLMFSYQNLFGYLYHKIGLLVALFMFGLAAGGWIFNRLIAEMEAPEERKGSDLLLLLAVDTAVLIYIFTLPLVIKGFHWLSDSRGAPATEAVLLSWAAIGGLLAGAEFPLASHTYVKWGGNLARAAGFVDSMDHLGAFIGAVFTGTLLVPLLGNAWTCAIVAAANFSSTILIILGFLKFRALVKTARKRI